MEIVSEAKKFTSIRRVPELSLKEFTYGTEDEKVRFIEALYTGIKDYGFINLKDHGVDEALLKRAYELSEQLFNLDNDVKNKYVLPDAGGARGYTPFGKEHAKDAQAKDLKEFWHVGRDPKDADPFAKYFASNIWPEEIPEFKDVYLKLFKELDQVGFILLKALTFPLGLPVEYFDELAGGGSSVLRLLHYPPIPEGVDPRCVRAAAHEDINLITLLVCASASGLQIKEPNGAWLDVETAPNLITVDAGDMLARITNDIIPSTTHRVINPAENSNVSRYSMPFFMHPHPEAILKCIPSCRGDGEKYPPIKANDFLMQRLREIGLIK